MSNQKSVSEQEANQLANSVAENWKVDPKFWEDRKKQTFIYQVRQKTASFLNENKGVALMAIASYATARGSGKTHEESMEYADIAWKHGKEVERLYTWFTNKIGI